MNQHPGETAENAVRRASEPTKLRITDIRVATIRAQGIHPIIRIDTNQGVYGLGEVRDGAHPDTALRLKPLIVGQNPCNVEYLFRRIKRYGGESREAGGVCAIEIALMDLVGKVYGIPCYQLLGGKFRDRVRVYGDTPTPDDPTPDAFREVVRSRKEMGLTFIKFDLSARMFEGFEGGMVGSDTKYEYPQYRQFHTPGRGAGARISEAGLDYVREVCAAVRDEVGPGISLCTDHFGEGFVTEDEAIRIGRAVEPYNLAWIEDVLPWTDIKGHRRVAEALLTPVAAGEDLYLFEGFREAIETRAFDIIHPDMLSSGGLTETKKIADHAERHQIPTALHACCSPIAFMANVHLAASLASLMAVENHALDIPWYTDIVTGLDKDYMGSDGYVPVPEAPGLGIDIVEEALEERLVDWSGLFAESTEWDAERTGFLGHLVH
ncbi:mandelate racemase/muconate lactonizing enzyme family protein [Wenxinia marina]|uniref:L-alanine-DL-glutamate epimerase n=1 Tax=Wenxinia marina DSM 24838 TaxID=1123501 RepID=A0A0D0Q5P3_9RHOB|nr:mandelate racemase/muconate lactonizing enzyme family protein [Wenxinia marina]KIQ69789.1 L-alanine-DL-glutamate epimerase [Wenxinia marina DSM 24838]GGL61218.1 mandelate racemase [Wenxinia marina]